MRERERGGGRGEGDRERRKRERLTRGGVIDMEGATEHTNVEQDLAHHNTTHTHQTCILCNAILNVQLYV